MLPTSWGAKTRHPILFRIVKVDTQWMHSRKVGGSHVAGKEYVIARRKHDQYRTAALQWDMCVR